MTAIPENKKIRKEQIKGVVKTIQEGTNITVDNTDPENPVVSASGGGGGITQETGAYTPLVKGLVSDPTYTAISTGQWIRVGDMLNLSIRISISAWSGGSGSVYITLPSVSGYVFPSYNYSGSIMFENITLFAGYSQISVLRQSISSNEGLYLAQMGDNVDSVNTNTTQIVVGTIINISVTLSLFPD